MGSLLISEGFPGVGAGTIGAYLDILDTVIDVFPETTIFVAGHGRPLDMEELKAYRRMVGETVRVVLEEKNKGKTLEEIVEGNALSKWSIYGKCQFLPYITDEIWIGAIYKTPQK
jgi:hypothetical protein